MREYKKLEGRFLRKDPVPSVSFNIGTITFRIWVLLRRVHWIYGRNTSLACWMTIKMEQQCHLLCSPIRWRFKRCFNFEKLFGPFYDGFRPGKSTNDQIFTMPHVSEYIHEKTIDAHLLFLDLKSAFDIKVLLTFCLYASMSAFGIPVILISQCKYQ